MPLLHNRRYLESQHKFGKPLEFPTIEAATDLNKTAVKHALIVSLAKSKDARLVPLLKINPFDGQTEVIEAVDGMLLPKVEKGIPLNQGDLGCLLSHIKALEYAKMNGWGCVMILEDDVTFADNFNFKLRQAMGELPETWDMLWLGGSNAKMPYPYSEHLKRLVSSWGTYGYVIRDTVYDYFIELFKEQKKSSDDYFRLNHIKFRSFRTIENLVIHKPGISDRSIINHTAKHAAITL